MQIIAQLALLKLKKYNPYWYQSLCLFHKNYKLIFFPDKTEFFNNYQTSLYAYKISSKNILALGRVSLVGFRAHYNTYKYIWVDKLNLIDGEIKFMYGCM